MQRSSLCLTPSAGGKPLPSFAFHLPNSFSFARPHYPALALSTKTGISFWCYSFCVPLPPSSCFPSAVACCCLCPSGWGLVSPRPSASSPAPALFSSTSVDGSGPGFWQKLRFLETQSLCWRCHLQLKCWVVAGAGEQAGLHSACETWLMRVHGHRLGSLIAVESGGATKTLMALGTGTWEQPRGGNAVSAKALMPGLGGSPK